MGVRFRSWWQNTRKPIEVIGFIAVLVIAIALIFVEVRVYGTGFKGKTLWDWLQLLIIPVVLALGGYLFTFTISRNERKAADRHNQTEREIAQDNQREAALQAYIDKMSELLLHEKLRESQPEDEVRSIARVRTLTVLRRLDSLRKGSVLQFLYESGLIDKNLPIIDLTKADLSEVNLIEANLRQADLSEANLNEAVLTHTCLTGVDLSEATLVKANLFGVDLSEANLSKSHLFRANLKEANLREADLRGAGLRDANLIGANLIKANVNGAWLIEADLRKADLRHTDLSKAFLSRNDLSVVNLSGVVITPEQLAEAKSLKGATMPDGSIHP